MTELSPINFPTLNISRMERVSVLDHGYVELIENWGSDEAIVEAARMSTDKGFLGWEPGPCPVCDGETHVNGAACRACEGKGEIRGDKHLLRYLWNNKHSTPFEFAGMTIEVQAPLIVFREWHRHRTQCLAPDTLIHFDAPKSRDNRRFVYKMRIEDIWKKWQPTVRSARPERQANALFPRSRIQAMQLRCMDEEAKEFIHTRIVDVIRGEAKPMVRVTTVSGRQLTATREHRVVTTEGWMTLGQAIASGALLALEGTTRGLASGWETPQVDGESEKWVPVVGWAGIYEVSDEGRVRRVGCEPKRTQVNPDTGYLYVGLNRPGEQVTRTMHSLVLEAFHGPSEGRETRHKNHNRRDARLQNLLYGSALDNARDRVSADRQQRLVPVFEDIVQVDDVGMFPTYDLTVAGPFHNFVADGFVVHNSYAERSARYTPLPNFNYMPTPERLLRGGGHLTKQAASVDGVRDAALAEERPGGDPCLRRGRPHDAHALLPAHARPLRRGHEVRPGLAVVLALFVVLAVTAAVKTALADDFQPQELSCL